MYTVVVCVCVYTVCLHNVCVCVYTVQGFMQDFPLEEEKISVHQGSVEMCHIKINNNRLISL